MGPNTPQEIYRAIADPTRLQILEFMLRVENAKRLGECFGGSISQALGLSQPTVSHHMKILVDAGLVLAQKKGTSVYYSLGRDGFQAIHDHLTPYLQATSPQQESP